MGADVMRGALARAMEQSESSAGSRSGDSLHDVEGVVKWFDPRKGFGFVVGPQGQDIFVHYSVIEGDGFRVLKDGSTVQYSAHRTDKGWKATKVSRVPELGVTVRVPSTSPAGGPAVHAPRDGGAAGSDGGPMHGGSRRDG